MRLNEKEIENIICNSVTENLICRALELRPGELAKFICGLANVNGGYILVGVEKDNGLLKTRFVKNCKIRLRFHVIQG